MTLCYVSGKIAVHVIVDFPSSFPVSPLSQMGAAALPATLALIHEPTAPSRLCSGAADRTSVTKTKTGTQALLAIANCFM